jgi:hypothetical protein
MLDGSQDALGKSLPLLDFAPLAAVPGVRLVDLQYGDTTEEREAFRHATGIEILHPSPDLRNDLDGLAALISACDAVVSVSSVIAHLASALGRAGRVLPTARQGLFWY